MEIGGGSAAQAGGRMESGGGSVGVLIEDAPADDVPGGSGEAGWRGVAAEEAEATEEVNLALAARSRRLLWSLLRPYRLRVIAALVIIVLDNAAIVAAPLFVAYGLDAGVAAAMRGDWSPLIVAVAGSAGCALLSGVTTFLFVRTAAQLSQQVLVDLRLRVFTHVQRLPVAFHETYTSGKIVARLTSDLESLEDLLDRALNDALSAVLSLATIAVVLLWLDVPLALVVLAGFVPLVYITRWAQRHQRAGYRRTRGAIAKVVVHFVETMGGIRAVQAFRREERNQTILGVEDTEYRAANSSALRGMAIYIGLVRAISGATTVVILLVGGWRVIRGDTAIGVLAAFLLYLRQFYGPLDELAQVFNSYQSAAAALERISGVLEERPTVPEPLEPRPVAEPGARARGKLRFDRVSFDYPLRGGAGPDPDAATTGHDGMGSGPVGTDPVVGWAEAGHDAMGSGPVGTDPVVGWAEAGHDAMGSGPVGTDPVVGWAEAGHDAMGSGPVRADPAVGSAEAGRDGAGSDRVVGDAAASTTASRPGDVTASRPGDATASRPGDATASRRGDATGTRPGDAGASGSGDAGVSRFGDRPTQLELSLTVPAGQVVALVGATGAGKSTLAKLVARFYDPTGGNVRLDGVDLRDIADVELRRNITMVTQESYLFSGSVADNIRLGKPEATDAEVRAAAGAVGLADFVDTLPEGFETDVRKRGGRLSAGQRQLVAFARVFLADPAVIVLDEATSSLDIPGERLVQRALETVLYGRTAVIIAHRLSTVAIADRVLVLEAGRVVEDGSPDELVAATGRFAALHTAWRESLV
ncbi:ABC transporter ATP-binding protein [Nocardia sp. BMG111209]|uniref:ABC transporter ATP-binding protein n=1 Tax=Nocardia sp. BMG111209 TaxID=1160137 RepID=UPI001E532B3C|nr:ABC transporter ATP-binding protein [Nocardia sp. BMG111209]